MSRGGSERIKFGWSVAGDAEGGFELAGELGHCGGNFGRLFAEVHNHALGHLRFGADQLGGGHDQGEVVINIMAEGGELVIKLLYLFHTQLDRLTGRTHALSSMAET